MKKNQNLTSYLKQIFVLIAIIFSFSKIKAPITCTNLTNYYTEKLITKNQDNLDENDGTLLNDFENEFHEMVARGNEVNYGDVEKITQEMKLNKKTKTIENDNESINKLQSHKSSKNLHKTKLKTPITTTTSIAKANIPKLTRQKTMSKFNVTNKNLHNPKLKTPITTTTSIAKANIPKLTRQKTMSKFNVTNKNLHNPKLKTAITTTASIAKANIPKLTRQKTMNRINVNIKNSNKNKTHRTSSVGINNNPLNKKEKDYLEQRIVVNKNKNMKNNKLLSTSKIEKPTFKQQPLKFEKPLELNESSIEKKPISRSLRYSSVDDLHEESFIKKLNKDTLINGSLEKYPFNDLLNESKI